MIEAPGRPQGPALLEVRDLHGWYGESHVLHGVSLDLHEGETITLVGRNGAGKTTTLRAIMNLLPRREGSIRIAGADMMKVPVHRTAYSGIGYVPEERGIFATLTVSENLLLPPTVAPGGMSIEEIYDLFPNLAERRNSPGTKLSGGEQQMLAIGRGLMSEPKLLILDEPSLGLSPLLVEEMFGLIEQLARDGLPIMLVEQNVVQSLDVASRAYILENGHVVLSGAAETLRDDPELKRAYLGL